MALVSSLFTAISGLRNHQTMLDVISNNVSNVNTIGFKAGRVMFRDLLSQTMSSAASADPLSNQGGVNAVQMGTGVSVAAIDTVQTQGTLQATGNPTDMAISGDGYFVVQAGNEQLFTRDGSFRIDSSGQLVNSSGGLSQGWTATSPVNSTTGQVDTLARLQVDSSNPANIGTITVDAGSTMAAAESRNVDLFGNLDAGATAVNCVNSGGLPTGIAQITVYDNTTTQYDYTVGQKTINFSIYDSLGNEHAMTATFTNVSDTQIEGMLAGTTYANNTWKWEVALDPNDTTATLVPDNVTYLDDPNDPNSRVRAAHSGIINFNSNGSLNYVAYLDANQPTLNATDMTSYQQWGLSADANRGSVIGFEGGNNIPFYDLSNADPFGGNALNVNYGAGTYDNPAGSSVAGLFPGPAAQLSAGAGFELSKLPIVVAFAEESWTNPPTLVQDNGLIAGKLVNAVDNQLAYTDMAVTAGVTPTNQLYVQKFDINWGSVSNITQADFDIMDQNAGGGPVSEAPGSFGDGERDFAIDPVTDDAGVAPIAVQSDGAGGRDGLTQDATGAWKDLGGGVMAYVPDYSAYMRAQDGYAQGTLQSISVSADGTIVGAYDNNEQQDLARVALATFQNPAGLAKIGDTHFTVTANSGAANIGEAGAGGRGQIIGGALEQSNVDLSQELTNMIVAQRGFEANARLITTSDRILDTLVNMGR